ncbi:hypothetical protein VL10_14600 [Leclercia adecarboxylata]|nr:hypothetical protein VL10_14600 [Leclercia adecarboxylata]KMN63742.1 hypothetical protein VK95_18830 [Leclercia sp. LK8]
MINKLFPLAIIFFMARPNFMQAQHMRVIVVAQGYGRGYRVLNVYLFLRDQPGSRQKKNG